MAWSTRLGVDQAPASSPAVPVIDPETPRFDFLTFDKIRSLLPKTERARLLGLNAQQQELWKQGKLVVPDEPPVAGLKEDYDEDGQVDRAIPVEITNLNGKTEYYLLLATHYPDGRWRLFSFMGVDSKEELTSLESLRFSADSAFTAGVGFRAESSPEWERRSTSTATPVPED